MLPYPKITKIPSEPDAVADESLWNARYEEQDANFENLDQRTGSLEDKVEPLETLPDELAGTIADVEALKPVSGMVTFLNRGIKWGGYLSRSQTTARNVALNETDFFVHGNVYNFPAQDGVASVPPNPSSEPADATIYLYIDNQGLPRCDCTPLDEDPPEDSLPIYRATVPAGNTEATDEYLSEVSIYGICRFESDWPMIQSVVRNLEVIDLKPYFQDSYQFSVEILSPANASTKDLRIEHREGIENGEAYKVVFLSWMGSEDNVKIQWTARGNSHE